MRLPVARRIRFATIAEFGLGLFVAVSVGVTLYMSGAAGVRSSQALVAERAETLLDALERRIETRLRPIDDQARWIAGAFAEGRFGLERVEQLDAFMLGALGATPQVAGLAIIDPRGAVRRWNRESGAAIAENWSARREITEWLERGRAQAGSAWRTPVWAQAGRRTVLLHDMPLHREGRFAGLLAQAVPVERLSTELAEFAIEADVTPFILHGADRVLAHPGLAGRMWGDERRAEPLPGLSEVGDAVLARIRSPEAKTPPMLRSRPGIKVLAAQVEGEQYIYILREMSRFGPEPWTLGAYLRAGGGVGTNEMKRVVQSVIAGLAVLVAAVLFAAIAGRRLSRPVQAIARAARAVSGGRLEDVPTLPASAIAEYDDASRSFNQMVQGLRERNLIRETLGRFVSEEVARGLLAGGGRLEPVETTATVLVCDLEEFTSLTESLGPTGVVDFLNAYFEVMVEIVERHRGVITQFQGDAIMAVFNVPLADPAHAANALRAALELVSATGEREFAGIRARNRVGISTGPLIAGAVGSRGRLTYTVHGSVVNMAARLEAMNKDYGTRILLSASTAALCEGFDLRKVADAAVRGYAEPVALFAPGGSTGKMVGGTGIEPVAPAV